MRRNHIIFGLLVVGMAVVSGMFWYRAGLRRPIMDTSRGLPDIFKKGNSDDAIVRGKALIENLKENNWDWLKVKSSFLNLPDQYMADDPEYRRANLTAWCIVPLDDPNIPEVAIYTDLYVRRNLKVYKGDTGTANPEGFYIVGFRDGNIERVPLSEVRVAVIKGQGRQIVFPGTKFYNKNLPLLYKSL